MGVSVFVVVMVNAALFGVLTGVGLWHAFREESPRIRVLSGAFAAACGAFVLGAATRAVAIAVRLGWLPGRVGDVLVSEWHAVQSVAALCFGVVTIVLLRRVGPPIRRAEQIVTVLADRFAPTTAIADLGLTPRELEVLEVIAQGTLSDKGIGDALFISPATAGTHVKNILRKAGVGSRRDLVLLVAAEPE